jgi:hypothetical protein
LVSRDFDLGLIGFEPDRLARILVGLGSSSIADPDGVPAVPAEPVSRPGEWWEPGHTVKFPANSVRTGLRYTPTSTVKLLTRMLEGTPLNGVGSPSIWGSSGYSSDALPALRRAIWQAPYRSR